jgi:hypothetical protein
VKGNGLWSWRWDDLDGIGCLGVVGAMGRKGMDEMRERDVPFVTVFAFQFVV